VNFLKRAQILLLVFLFALAFSGCGGGGGSSYNPNLQISSNGDAFSFDAYSNGLSILENTRRAGFTTEVKQTSRGPQLIKIIGREITLEGLLVFEINGQQKFENGPTGTISIENTPGQLVDDPTKTVRITWKIWYP